MMREVIPCTECARMAKDYGVGFTSTPKTICTRDTQEVDVDDGCTLGERGRPSYIARDVDVELNGHEAVYGNTEEA